jgi:hypothetical protein
MPPLKAAHILAQDSIAVEAQLALFFQQLISPIGVAGAVIAAGVLVWAIVFRKMYETTAGIALGSVMFQLHPDALTQNLLLGPLQAYRYASKSIAFGLLVLAALAALAIRLDRRWRAIGFAAASFYAFQVYYTLQLLVFANEGLARGFFGVIAITLMFTVFGIGMGRRMQDAASARSALELLAWLAVAFITINMVQLAAGTDGAFVGGRLAGIGGNAQMMGGISAMLLLACVYLANDLPAKRPLRWMSLASAGILGIFILATGSRTATTATVLGLASMFRLQMGRLLVFGILGGLVAFVGISGFEQSSSGVDRMLQAPNTRADVWAEAVAAFMTSPIVGNLPFSGSPDTVFSGVESTFLRTLANLGLVGLAVVLMPFGAMVLAVPKALWLGKADPSYRRLTDFYVASVAAILVLNTLDGYAFGLLTFPVIFMYITFTLGDFIQDSARELVAATDSAEPLGEPSWT